MSTDRSTSVVEEGASATVSKPPSDGHEDQRSNIRIQRVRHQRRYGDRRDRSLRDGSKIVTVQRASEVRRGLDPRTDGELVTEHLERDDQVHGRAAQTALLLGNHQSR